MMIDGKDIRVASVKTFGDGHVYRASDQKLKKGIYVVAAQDEDGAVLPRTTALIRDYLRSRGFNAVARPDGCELGMKFLVHDLSIDDDASVPGASSAVPARSLSERGADLAGDAGTAALAVRLNGPFLGALAYGMAGRGHYEGT